ncbi:MAG: VOC family protein [Actinobacteria bacterium]|nr:VOC family protein [Actinomycetota bacterium]
MAGRVVHFEIPHDDGDRARAFYEKAFGWQLMPMPEMGYTIVMTGPSSDQGPTEAGFVNGGMMQRQGEFTGPNIVIDVDNIEDALKAVNDAGGSTVHERMPIGDMGFAAYFRDSEGNFVGLWETKTA